MSQVTAQALFDPPPVVVEGDLLSGLAGESDRLSHKSAGVSHKSERLSRESEGLPRESGGLYTQSEALSRESGGLYTQSEALSREFGTLIYAVRSLVYTAQGLFLEDEIGEESNVRKMHIADAGRQTAFYSLNEHHLAR